MGHEVDGLGGIAHEDELARVGGVDEVRDLDPRALVGRRGLLADGVDGAVDVGAVGQVVGAHGLGDHARLERGGGTVEVGQALAMELPFEDREVPADGLGVEGSGGVHGCRVGVTGRP